MGDAAPGHGEHPGGGGVLPQQVQRHLVAGEGGGAGAGRGAGAGQLEELASVDHGAELETNRGQTTGGGEAALGAVSRRNRPKLGTVGTASN